MDYRNPIIVLAMAIGGFVSRWHGGGFIPGSPKGLKNAIWALPFAVATGLLASWWLAPIAFVLCLAGKATGHGGGMDLGTWTKPRKDEALEFIVKPLQGKIPEYWYDVIQMCLYGLAAVSGAVFCIAWFNPLAAGIIALGGLMKGPAYMIGWAVDKPTDKIEPTAIGEFLTGVFAFGACAVTVLVV